MIDPPPPSSELEPDDFGEWEPELHKLIEKAGFERPEMYCLVDRIKGKYRQPYREEKEPEDQSAVNTIRVLVDGQPLAIGQYLPRLKSVIAPPADRIRYYVPKEIRTDANKLASRLREASSPKS